MSVSWTPMAPNAAYTGLLEWAIDPVSGIVYWRGTITFVLDAATFPSAPPPRWVATTYIEYVGWAGTQLNMMWNGSVWNTFAPVGTVRDMSDMLYPGIGAATEPSEPGAFELPPLGDHSLSSVMEGVGNALRTLLGLRVYDFPSNRIEPPAAVLSLPETPYDVTLGGRTDEWKFPIWLLIAKADDRASYAELVPYLEAEGPKSIRAMLEYDRTLGGGCDTASVVNARPMYATIAGTEYLAVEFTLEVYT